MKMTQNDFPKLRTVNNRAVVMNAPAEILKESGMGNGATTRFKPGDIIEFPDEIHLSTVEVNAGQRPANLVGVSLNGKGAWVYASAFRRMDAHNEPCGEVCAANIKANYANDYAMIESMLGKRITVYASAEIDANVFQGGQVTGTRKQTIGLMKFE